MFSFRKEEVNEISNATRAILVKNKRSQALPMPLVKNKEEKRKDILLLFLCISVFALLFSSCGRRTEGEVLKAPAEDKRLLIYTSHKEELWKPIVKEFEERTGIWVEVVSGGTNLLLEEIAEKKGEVDADLFFGGGVESLNAFSEYFIPYEAKGIEEVDPQFRSASDVWTPFSALPVVLIYNEKLLSPEELSSWEDVLNPKFKGKIAMANPAHSASAFTGLLSFAEAVQEDTDSTEDIAGDKEILPRIAKQLDGKEYADSGEVPEAVADGSELVGITLEETALKYMAKGKNIGIIYPKEGTTVVPDAGAILKGAKHLENAQKFLDFSISKDCQDILQKRFHRRAVLKSMAGEGEPSLLEIKKLSYDIPKISAERNRVLTDWSFYMGLIEEEEKAS
ncbi:hypothetical protein HMPREF9624_01815 [Oribacterium asaccharolyticum ACB7]|uniref:Iron ABC transporter substrate-binding protein n=1 Tax=Oribacterium asaccharolyticum ACB7 TaxID=796944 RepID=G9WRU9_9FIRM|nr:extracellular solute-binding protein [Oribacterium asaccharolyticum]EHL14039.1 hypothetical protein HMPREF9624_01815 [Oribacterium asaccharolyticum ACB7]